MSYEVESKELENGYTVRVMVDDSAPESPRDWCNVGTFYTAHKRYNSPDSYSGYCAINSMLADLGKREQNIFSNENVLEIINSVGRDAIALPVWMYDHSGTCYKAAESNPFNCPWDSGLAGVIFVSKKKAREEFGRLTKENIAKVIACLKSEVDIYSSWANGEVYGFIVEDSEGEEIDSCWGFVGDSDYAMSEGISSAEYEGKTEHAA